MMPLCVTQSLVYEVLSNGISFHRGRMRFCRKQLYCTEYLLLLLCVLSIFFHSGSGDFLHNAMAHVLCLCNFGAWVFSVPAQIVSRASLFLWMEHVGWICQMKTKLRSLSLRFPSLRLSFIAQTVMFCINCAVVYLNRCACANKYHRMYIVCAAYVWTMRRTTLK